MRSLLAIALLLAACGGSDRLAISLGATAVPDAGPALAQQDAGDAGGSLSTSPDAGSAPVQPAGPSLAGCPMFPASSEWNRDISGDAVDAHSGDYLAFMGAGSLYLHPDFGGQYGQPFVVVGGGQARVPMSFLYSAQSDPGPYPFPADLPIQDAADRHAAVIDSAECKIYETYYTYAGGGGFSADSGAVFDLITGAPRPAGWTSATAAGLPILPGLARYDEVMEAGAVLHALSFTAGSTAHAYVTPATHSSGTSSAPWAPPLGLRVRLRADFDLSRFHGASLVVLRALQRYGMFLDDTGGGQFWDISGAVDARWPVSDLDQIKTVPVSALEVVRLPALHTGL